jgi:hypothetical protein
MNMNSISFHPPVVLHRTELSTIEMTLLCYWGKLTQVNNEPSHDGTRFGVPSRDTWYSVWDLQQHQDVRSVNTPLNPFLHLILK